MDKTLQGVYYRLGIIFSIGVLVLIIDDFLLRGQFFHEYKWYLLLFFALQSLLTAFISSKGLRKDINVFQVYFLTAVLLRMCFSSGLIFYVAYQGISNLLWFVATFFILYFSFLFSEIYGLLVSLKISSEK